MDNNNDCIWTLQRRRPTHSLSLKARLNVVYKMPQTRIKSIELMAISFILHKIYGHIFLIVRHLLRKVTYTEVLPLLLFIGQRN